MKLAVIIATLGRPETVAEALTFLRQQTRPADQIIIAATKPADVPQLANQDEIRAVFSAKGLPIQRNAGIAAARGEADIAIFFDDDFAPAPDYLATVERMFAANPDLAGLTGDVILDGIQGPGLSFADARQRLASYTPPAPEAAVSAPTEALYGCNMAIRLSLTEGIGFDEQLPLYAWQEDVDFTGQLVRRGAALRTNAMGGVHLGIKSARVAGLPMGYAQIANPIYMRRKRTIPAFRAYKLMFKNFTMNLLRSPNPEPWWDRRGRLAGNLLGLRDLLLGRLHPQNMLKLVARRDAAGSVADKLPSPSTDS